MCFIMLGQVGNGFLPNRLQESVRSCHEVVSVPNHAHIVPPAFPLTFDPLEHDIAPDVMPMRS